MYVNNIEPEMFLPPGSESFNHNATRTTSSRSRSNNVNNNIVPVYMVLIISRLSKKFFLFSLQARNVFMLAFIVCRHIFYCVKINN